MNPRRRTGLILLAAWVIGTAILALATYLETVAVSCMDCRVTLRVLPFLLIGALASGIFALPLGVRSLREPASRQG